MLAIVAAFKDEIKDYLKWGRFRVVAQEDTLRYRLSEDVPDVVVVDGAWGRERVEQATARVIERFHPDTVVSAGFAGAAHDHLHTGDMLICERLMSMEGPAALWKRGAAAERRSSSVAVLNRRPRPVDGGDQMYLSGGCMTLPQLVSSSSMKSWIGASFPVSVVDMESFWFSEAADSLGVPHLVVRSVLDEVEQDLPEFVEESLGDEGSARIVHAIRYVVTNISDTGKLMRLSGQVRTARAPLGRFLASLSGRGKTGPESTEDQSG